MAKISKNFGRVKETIVKDDLSKLKLDHDTKGYLLYIVSPEQNEVKVIARDKSYQAIWGAFCFLGEHKEVWEHLKDIDL